MLFTKSAIGAALLSLTALGGTTTIGADAPRSTRAAATATKPILTLAEAQRVLEAGRAMAQSLDAGGAIAVVDDGGYLLALSRPEGTFPAAAEVATAKARTAATFHKATEDFENAIKGGRTSLVAVGPMTPLEGGVPIVIDGRVVGAVGVSGAHSSTEDVQIARAAAAASAP